MDTGRSNLPLAGSQAARATPTATNRIFPKTNRFSPPGTITTGARQISAMAAYLTTSDVERVEAGDDEPPVGCRPEGGTGRRTGEERTARPPRPAGFPGVRAGVGARDHDRVNRSPVVPADPGGPAQEAADLHDRGLALLAVGGKLVAVHRETAADTVELTSLRQPVPRRRRAGFG